MNLLADIFVEEFFNLVKGDDILLVVEVAVACSGNHHEELVVGFAGSDGQLLVGIAAEVEGMRFFSVKNHDGVLDLAGTAHQREVDPWNCRGDVATAVGIERAWVVSAFGLVVIVIVAEEISVFIAIVVFLFRLQI